MKSKNKQKRVISFSKSLRERIGHHIYGDRWANTIKYKLKEVNFLIDLFILLSANMHSVMNYLYAKKVSSVKNEYKSFEQLSLTKNDALRNEVLQYALLNGLQSIKDDSGTNIDVQIIDLSKVDISKSFLKEKSNSNAVLIVMDYAFGEQAYECMDELLKHLRQMEVRINSTYSQFLLWVKPVF